MSQDYLDVFQPLPATMSSDEAHLAYQRAVNTWMADPSHPLMNRTHPLHQAHMLRKELLAKRAYGSEPVNGLAEHLQREDRTKQVLSDMAANPTWLPPHAIGTSLDAQIIEARTPAASAPKLTTLLTDGLDE